MKVPAWLGAALVFCALAPTAMGFGEASVPPERERNPRSGILPPDSIVMVVTREGPGWRVTWLSGTPAAPDERLCLKRLDEILICQPVEPEQYTGVIQAPGPIPVRDGRPVLLPSVD